MPDKNKNRDSQNKGREQTGLEGNRSSNADNKQDITQAGTQKDSDQRSGSNQSNQSRQGDIGTKGDRGSR